jgi:hypothetical protein
MELTAYEKSILTVLAKAEAERCEEFLIESRDKSYWNETNGKLLTDHLEALKSAIEKLS